MIVAEERVSNHLTDNRKLCDDVFTLISERQVMLTLAFSEYQTLNTAMMLVFQILAEAHWLTRFIN